MSNELLLWIGFNVFVLAMLALDLGVFHRKAHEVKIKEALWWSAVWIALALTTFATWRPARVLLGAYLFGGVTMLQFHLQGQGVEVPSQFLTMLPYIATIVVLALISRNPAFIRLNMPASLGKPFHS